MKWLVYGVGGVLGVLVVAVIVLLVMGARSDRQIAGSVEIARPPDVVFRWVTDAPRLQSWVAWLVDVRNVTPEQGRVGARQVWVMEDRNNNNQRMEIETEVVAFQPNQLLNARLNAPGLFTGSVEYQLDALAADRTRLTYTMKYDYDQWFVELLEPLIAMSAQQKLEDDLARLKEKAESEPRGYAQGK